MSQTLDLYRLQLIDSQRDQIASRLAEIERILAEDRDLACAQAQVNAAVQANQAANKRLRLAEESVHAQHIKIEQSEATLYGGKVKSPKELQDLQNEVASLKKYLGTLEDTQLEAMLALEETEEQHKVELANLEEVQALVARKHGDLNSEQARLKKNMERLDAEHKATLPSIQADVLELYEKLRQQRHGLAVANVVDKTCEACGTTLTPSSWQAARSPHQISRCPTCGRILYAE